jgi:hypothetical protein
VVSTVHGVTTAGVVLPRSKADYLRSGLSSVEGFCESATALYLSGLEVAQRGLGVSGDVCEIGVHHGKSFFCLALGLPPGDRAVAVDVFEDQAANVDRSGRGDRETFEKHQFRLGCGEVEVLAVSSLLLEATGFLEAGPRFRMFSIDGGHTAAVTHNDLRVAERTVVPGGLVAVDDLLNPHWLGVVTGLFDYWFSGGSLVPAVLVPNKLLLTTSEQEARRYRDLMRERFRAANTKCNVPIGDHLVDVYGGHPWVVEDDEGRTGLLQPDLLRDRTLPDTRVVPDAFLAALERRLKQAESALADRRHRSVRGRVARAVGRLPLPRGPRADERLEVHARKP